MMARFGCIHAAIAEHILEGDALLEAVDDIKSCCQ